MLHTRIKICGLTRPDDALLAVELGADLLGLNFVAGPRKLDLPRAAAILQVLPPQTEVVALVRAFRTAAPPAPELAGSQSVDPLLWDLLADSQEKNPPGRPWRTFQVYGSTDPGFPRARFAAPPARIFRWWPVLAVPNRQAILNLPQTLAALAPAQPDALVLDAAAPGQLGGTGQRFDWHWLAEARAAGMLDLLPPIVLAGGLSPDNVAQAVRLVRPWAVDVSSGVENRGTPGIKDPKKMRDFIQAVRGVDA